MIEINESTRIHLLIYVFYNPDLRYVFYVSYLFFEGAKTIQNIFSYIKPFLFSLQNMSDVHNYV